MALTVYQLKVVLRDVKPAVWRRVLVAHDATIRTLHETVQVVMGWANCHLHRFIIHGKEYGVAYEDGISFADNPDKVRLSDFRFQPHERFKYVYDLGDNWEHDIRVEKILALDPSASIPHLHWWSAALSARRFRRPLALYVSAAHEKPSQRASENAFTWQGQ